MEFSSLWTDTSSSLNKVIWAFYIGIVLAFIIMWFNQKVLGGIVRTLLKKEIFSPDKALTLKEAGLDGFFARKALSKEFSPLRKSVFCTLDKPKLQKSDFNEARFYIPQELKYKADVRYQDKNTSVLTIIITAVVMFVIALLAVEYLPMLLDMFKD